MASCVFCDISRGLQPADIVYHDSQVIAFRDKNPQAPVHILVIPREHIPGPLDASVANEAVIGHMIAVAAQVARAEGLSQDGYRLVLNQGRDGGQSVFHIHLHLLGGRRLGWPPG